MRFQLPTATILHIAGSEVELKLTLLQKRVSIIAGDLNAPKPAYERERFVIQFGWDITAKTLAFTVVALDASGILGSMEWSLFWHVHTPRS